MQNMVAPFTNSQYGKFATTSRLISCLIIENLATAYYYSCPEEEQQMVGLCLVLRTRRDSRDEDEKHTSLTTKDLLAVVPLRGIPELNSSEAAALTLPNGVQCPKIELLDPWDMLAPHIFGLYCDDSSPNPKHSQGVRTLVTKALETIGLLKEDQDIMVGYDAVQLWTKFSRDYGVSETEDSKAIASEVANSIIHQTYTYDHPKPLPTLESPPYQWEQLIFEGHPYHPMHKLRISAPPLPPVEPGQVDWDTPKLRLVAIPKESITLRGDFEQRATPLIDAMLQPTGKVQDQRAKYAGTHVFMPVHEFQVPNIQAKFKDALVFPEANSVTAHCLTSIRTVAVPDVLKELTVKLCVGIKVTSALRIISVYSTYFGPGFSTHVVPRLVYDRSILTVERDLASAIYHHDDPHVAKHCSCILREAVEYPSNPVNSDAFVVTGALVEKIQKPGTDETLVTHVWKLDTEEKRAAFLDRYIELALKAFIPPCRENGVAFEAHGQNTVARFDKETGVLKGFVIRDFGGLSIHRETLEKSCDAELDVLPDSSIVAESMDLVYNRLYHSLFHTHLQRLIRVLGMHHNGRGWEMVRRYFTELVPKNDPMYAYFMEQSKVSGKCLISMKLDGLYRDDIFRPFPNVILTPRHA
ncbi:IucC family-domain-containing protein [Zychaea mexicana]|uniref:IucC family-domain-containing protein n=1 Tax=Zychaea mexicana TaxID=64656 RepID=UPI0022FED6D3|nr:IucC family-domain-containing protein [Zychaea mexicana]KAI9497663.1 IucC family-domain-containing protein [Zychaea mexicana]